MKKGELGIVEKASIYISILICVPVKFHENLLSIHVVVNKKRLTDRVAWRAWLSRVFWF